MVWLKYSYLTINWGIFYIVSLPEHNVLRASFSDRSMSGVPLLWGLGFHIAIKRIFLKIFSSQTVRSRPLIFGYVASSGRPLPSLFI